MDDYLKLWDRVEKLEQETIALKTILANRDEKLIKRKAHKK